MGSETSIKRRNFIKTVAITGAAGLSAATAQSQAPKTGAKRQLKRDFLRIGMIGLGPYSHAMAYTETLNDPTVPPRTNMKVVAVWGKEDKYLSSFKGSEEFKKKRSEELSGYMSRETFTKKLGVKNVVKQPADMLNLVDAVFITDPEDSLNLARPFLQKGLPVFINRPMAYTIKDAREIVKLAKASGSVLVTGSCIPWMNEFQVARSRIDPNKVQHYYVDGSTANMGSYLPHILELAKMVVGGKVIRCSTHGVTWPADEDPLSIPPVMVHLEHEKTSKDRNPVIGVASTWFGQPNRNWIKVHLDDDVVEQSVFWEGSIGASQSVHVNEHLWTPILQVIDRAFQTGVWPQDADTILNKVETMLMAHKSGIEGGRPVGISEIEDHSLARYESEKA
ncbi:MAG: Gfo/Idh/MocA family oxidoreductase [Candidatus Latescibacterota bacterium]